CTLPSRPVPLTVARGGASWHEWHYVYGVRVRRLYVDDVCSNEHINRTIKSPAVPNQVSSLKLQGLRVDPKELTMCHAADTGTKDSRPRRGDRGRDDGAGARAAAAGPRRHRRLAEAAEA